MSLGWLADSGVPQRRNYLRDETLAPALVEGGRSVPVQVWVELTELLSDLVLITDQKLGVIAVNSALRQELAIDARTVEGDSGQIVETLLNWAGAAKTLLVAAASLTETFVGKVVTFNTPIHGVVDVAVSVIPVGVNASEKYLIFIARVTDFDAAKLPTWGANKTLAAVVDAFSDAAAVIDEQGAVVVANALATVFLDSFLLDPTHDYLGAPQPADWSMPRPLSDWFVEELAKVCLFGNPTVLDNVAIDHPVNGFMSVRLTLAPLPHTDFSAPPLVLATMVDATELVVTKAALELSRVELGEAKAAALGAVFAERASIARELHDDVLQQLVAIKWMVQVELESPVVALALDAAIRALRSQATKTASQVAFNGLAAALAQLATLASTACSCVLVGPLDLVPFETGELVWRTVREALRNVDAHAAASNAHLVVEVVVAVVNDSTFDGHVVVRVEDDGVGVTASALAKAGADGHFGIETLKESILVSGGSCSIVGRPAGGTTVRCTVPFKSV